MGTHPIFESDFDCLTEKSDWNMPHARSLVQSKTFVTPSRCYEKARLDQELKLVGEFGLRNKREVWRVKLAVAKVRKVARTLLTLEEKDPKRLFESCSSPSIGQNWCPSRRPNETRLRSRSQNRELPRKTSPNPSFQTRTCQVYPSRPCSYQTKTHPCQKTGCQCPIIRCQT